MTQPALSVIFTTAGAPGPLVSCLRALVEGAGVTADAFEVVVVPLANGAAIQTAVTSLGLPVPVRVEYPTAGEAASLSAARNRGAQRAVGHTCLFLDASVVPGPGLVAAHLQAQASGDPVGVVGMGRLDEVLPRGGSALARFAADSANTRWQRLAEAGSQTLTPADCSADNLSVPREAFLASGGFAQDLPPREGVDLAQRLVQRGLPLRYVPEARAQQPVPATFTATVARYERQGESDATLIRRYPPLMAQLPIGAFSGTSLRSVLLRRLFLALNVRPAWLEPFGRLFAGRSWSTERLRFMAEYAYWRGVRGGLRDRDTWERLVNGPQVLMYHAFGEPGERASRWILPGRRFARQLAWLRIGRYHVLELDELLAYRRDHRLPPPRSVALTFDDGYRDNATVALPLLRRFRFPATVFAVTGFLGSANSWDAEGELRGRPLLSWDQVLALPRQGVRVAPHTHTHPRLPELTEERICDEVGRSVAALADARVPPSGAFAYPHGQYDAASLAAVAQAGFQGACGGYAGVCDPAVPRFALRRNEVRGTDSLLDFALLLACGRSRPLARFWAGR
jgi:peptidoglycan/xylan/chitin deacetylase (PgdA/CDA1 family)